MNGLSTRQHLRRALHPDVAGDIPRLTDLPPAPIDNPNAHGLGTPMHGERIKAARRERRYARAFKFCIWAILLAAMFIVGRNTAQQRDAVAGTSVYYRMKADRLDPRQRLCEIDPHEGCLVCMHKDATGATTISSHC